MTIALSYTTSGDTTSHHSGHSTLSGVLVANTTVSCSAKLSRRLPKRSSAAWTSQGSSFIWAFLRKWNSFLAIRSGSRAEVTLPDSTICTTIVEGEVPD